MRNRNEFSEEFSRWEKVVSLVNEAIAKLEEEDRIREASKRDDEQEKGDSIYERA